MSAQAFFRDLRAALTHTWRTQGEATRTEAVLLQAWDSFEGNVAIQSEGQPAIACAKGCPSCCTLRVTATAAEACRGHASHDRQACVQAAAGRSDNVPFSNAHRVVRLLVQSALQAAVREQGLAWGAYELNHALVLALDQPDSHADWLRGGDPLAAAAVDQELRAAMAADFDSIPL